VGAHRGERSWAVRLARRLILLLTALILVIPAAPPQPAAAQETPSDVEGAYRSFMSIFEELGGITGAYETLAGIVEAFAPKGEVAVRLINVEPGPFNVELGMSYQVPFQVSYSWGDTFDPDDNSAFVETYVILDKGSDDDPDAKVVYYKRFPEIGYFEDSDLSDNSVVGAEGGSIWLGAKSYDPELRPTRVRVVTMMYQAEDRFALPKHRGVPITEIADPKLPEFTNTAFPGPTEIYWRGIGQYADRQVSQPHHFVAGYGLQPPVRGNAWNAIKETPLGGRVAAVLGGLRVLSYQETALNVTVHNPFFVSSTGQDGRSDNGTVKALTNATWFYNDFTIYANYSLNYPTLQVLGPEPPVATVNVSGLVPSNRWEFDAPEPAQFRLAVNALQVTAATPPSQRVAWRGRWPGPRSDQMRQSSYTGEWNVTVSGVGRLRFQSPGSTEAASMRTFEWTAPARHGPQAVLPLRYEASDTYTAR
jgi:hypothetical protein